MSGKLSIGVVLVLILTSSCSAKQRTKRRQLNILYFLLDDVGFNDVGWNNPRINTPVMNKLAKEGVILNNFYTMPVCTPSRTTLMTGLYAQASGLQRGVIQTLEPYGVPLKFKILPETLKSRGGYATHVVGKWHLGFCSWSYTPLYRGVDSFLGFYNGAEENYNHCLSKYNIYDPISNCTQYDLRRDNKDIHEQYMEVYSTSIYTKRSEEIIERHPRNKPLFMYIALTDAHFPVQPPERFREGCEDEPTEARINFCAAMASSDEAVGKIVSALKKRGLYENTVIVLSSDNGGTVHFGGSNYPLRGNKGGLWEGGTRVPAFVHSPLLEKKGYVHEGLFHMVDWYPTFLHLAGIKAGKSLHLQGVNQWKAISEGEESARDEFPYSVDVIENVLLGAVRKGDWKYIASSGGIPDNVIPENETTDESYNSTYLNEYVTELPFDLTDTTPKLFNLAEDPSEERNLAESEPEKVRELAKLLDYYLSIAKPAVKIANDPAGDPENFDGVFTPGWCTPYYDVPVNDTKRHRYMSMNIGDLI